jgi:hypothetical protein
MANYYNSSFEEQIANAQFECELCDSLIAAAKASGDFSCVAEYSAKRMSIIRFINALTMSTASAPPCSPCSLRSPSPPMSPNNE